MGKIQHDQSGFGALEALLILVIVGILGFTGWYVYHARQNADRNLVAAGTSQAQAPASPYDGWKSFTLADEKLSFKYPSAWQLKDYTNSGTGNQDYHADWLEFTSQDGFTFTLNDGLNGTGDSLALASGNPVAVSYASQKAYLVFTHPGNPGAPGSVKSNLVGGFILLTNPADQTSVPKDKNIHGTVAGSPASAPGILVINAGYNAKTFPTVQQAMQDREFQNAKLVIESMHY